MPSDEWGELTEWWLGEVERDPAYRQEVMPLLVDLLDPQPGGRYLELGCGEGQGLRAVAARGGRAMGCDLSQELLLHARQSVPVVRARLPELGWVRCGSFDGAYVVLVLEHLLETAELFRQAVGTVRRGGCLVAVLNHPAFSAPGAGPVVDQADGELLWRWGRYLERAVGRQPAGERTVAFVHRPLGELLTEAAGAGWCLERLEERPAGREAAARDPLLALQRFVPRLLGVRWSKP